MNPVVRQILDNTGRLGRELENSQLSPPQMNGGTMSNERTVSVEGEVSHSPLPASVPVMVALLFTVSNVITTGISTAAQQGPSNS